MQAPGTVLQGRYKILRPGEQGTSRAAYEALDTRFGTSVTLGELQPEAEPVVREAFEREARVLNAVFHPSLPFVFDVFEEAGRRYYVTRAVPADRLGRLVAARGAPLGLAEALDIADRLLGAIERLHAHQPALVHCNVTPASVLLTKGGDLLLRDFELMVESPGPPLGYTLPYAPPEQIKGLEVGPACDLYAVGCLLYYLLTGVQPPSAFDRVSGGPTTLAAADEVNGAVPHPLADVVHMAMAVRAEDRPRSTSDFRAMLKEAAGIPQLERVVSEMPTVALEPRLAQTPTVGTPGPCPRTTVICRTCGATNDSVRTFCPFCGSLLRADQRAYEAIAGESREEAPIEVRVAAPHFPPDPSSVRLLVVEGEEPGSVLPLHFPETALGRSDGDHIFPHDLFMSSRHARVVYREGAFYVQDENSRNGTFIRIRGEVPLQNGDMFLIGTQLLRFEAAARRDAGNLRVVYHDGATGERFVLRGTRTLIGRHEGDIVFPSDASMADAHAFVEFRNGHALLVDCGSHNGTYIRVTGERRLHDGDLLIVGQHILRFEDDDEAST